ncbi:PspC domain-containing protein [Lactococcus carnosus]|uniref:PspC domain-containing protein n=1 Tax=Pseudolactococcus carnosus TaxID=2749961 RepID=UPI001FB872A5|nr:PspC domain-containing protein [Lactococcus carnosus]MCJ1978569.1 PspC domain-containing protein [Lactococcus carnosus]
MKKDDHIFLGVCSKLSEFLNVDPFIVRLCFLFTGSVILYFVLAYLLDRKETM